MNLRRLGAITALGLAGILMAASLSAAQRAFVSAGSGSDANPCTRAAPCRSFNIAIASTDPGGEIVVLDSGGYGSFTVTAALSVVAPEGVHGAVTTMSGPAITVSAGASDVVTVRGLAMNALGGNAGIHFTSGNLVVDRCRIQDFPGNGITRLSTGSLTVLGTTVRRTFRGLNDSASTAQGAIHVEDSIFERNTQHGIVLFNVTAAVIRNAVLLDNASSGIHLQQLNVGDAWAVVEGTLISGNAVGLSTSGTNTEIALMRSTVVFNVNAFTGNVVSRNDNTWKYNGGSVPPTFAAD